LTPTSADNPAEPMTDIAVGRVGRAHGVRGEAFVAPWTDTPDERFVIGALLRTEPAEHGPLRVAEAKNHSGKLVVRFDGITSRSAIEQLRGTMLLIDAATRSPIADPDEFYDTDLVGLSARDLTGATVGAVTDVLHSAAGSVLVIDLSGREVLLPFRKAMVPTVDLQAGFLVLDPPAGLFEL
jgi:16S rRNA processing protein RimM